MAKAIYAGSFDPFTDGHWDIVAKAADIFDQVFIVFADNAKKTPRFDRNKMADAADRFLKRVGFTNISVIVSEDLIVDVAQKLDADYLVRGVRSTTDFLYEEEMAKINNELDPGIETIYLRATNEVLSSSMVKELFDRGRDIYQYVPKEVYDIMMRTGSDETSTESTSSGIKVISIHDATHNPDGMTTN